MSDKQVRTRVDEKDRKDIESIVKEFGIKSGIQGYVKSCIDRCIIEDSRISDTVDTRPAVDHNIYRFVHKKTGRVVFGKRADFVAKVPEVSLDGVGKLVRGTTNFHHGWYVENRSHERDINIDLFSPKSETTSDVPIFQNRGNDKPRKRKGKKRKGRVYGVHNPDDRVHRFMHPKHGVIRATRHGFLSFFPNLNSGGISLIINGKCDRYKGWKYLGVHGRV